ncbi:DUF167 domain-containing protein [Pelagerythrobacter aerophilus]|uniref:UPF0235 protein D2V04_01780 n=1 Tax=Pelagerythrobacter aerophilus TaxID=2306995 RepID=A0A418NLR6_9SPHN|nr:DUF167 domain-containing protein [Pelagerythrobacter aerophilus]RIV76009.1 DUF167 domain-containing protein [Pelagerythrobacter aerophilus]RIV80736.1 DUF167 domain-containing protein [Pelagerythrobacter aerophilus]
MARPKADFPAAQAIRALADSEGRLALRVTPGARSESVAIENGRLLMKVRAKPTDGAANAAVLTLLGKALGIGSSRLQLLRGATSREKLIQLPDVQEP